MTIVAWLLAAAPLAAQDWTAPRTPWGDPDLQGTYTNNDESGIPMERPADLADADEVSPEEFARIVRDRAKNFEEFAPAIGGAETGAGPAHWYENYNAQNSRLWLVTDPPDGHIPSQTDEGLRRAAAYQATRPLRDVPNSWTDMTLYDRCLTRGVVGSMLPVIYGNSYQIVQTPGYVALRYEMVHETRIIPLDGRGHLSPDIRGYMGDARGHWDGDTLVVEATNFNGRTSISVNGGGVPHSDRLRLVERFTAVGPDTVEWRVTIDDPGTWTRPWTFAMNLTRDPSQQIFEYACHEGNYGLRDILSAARVQEPAAAR